MSKKSVVEPRASWGYGYVVSSNIQDRLVGYVFGIIEALGLPEKQEEATKSLIRGKVWDVFESAVYITEERHNEIRETQQKMCKESDELKTPHKAI